MKPIALASIIAAGLVAVSLAGVGVYVAQDSPLTGSTHAHAAETEGDAVGADLAAFHGGHAGDGEHNGAAGMERPSFPEAVGTTPTAATASSLEEVRRIVIESDEDFTPASGIRSGAGTPDDPYIISGYHVLGDLFLRDTDACFIVKENFIAGQLTLNWNGQCTHVHHNYIRDLRVNENNRRTGFATGGLLELNTIEFVGQLRHYDGEFRNNVVGPYTQESMWDPVMETVPWMFGEDPRVANIDGFNQGLIHHNTFFGSVDLDLHGHHHGTGFFAPHSHYHGGEMDKGMAHDHTQRWTSVAFTDNRIVDPEGYGLRYEDRNHAGDDRTANSEEEETLNLDHFHYTHIVMARNQIEGGQLWVDVFNADDNNHHARNPGWLDVIGNTVRFNEREAEQGPLGLPFFGPGTDWYSAMHIHTAKEVTMTIEGNTVEFVPLTKSSSNNGPLPDVDLWPFDDTQEMLFSGILLSGVKDSNVTLADNKISGFDYGVHALRFDDKVAWEVSGNDYGDAQYPIYYDESVANQPTGDDI